MRVACVAKEAAGYSARDATMGNGVLTERIGLTIQ